MENKVINYARDCQCNETEENIVSSSQSRVESEDEWDPQDTRFNLKSITSNSNS